MGARERTHKRRAEESVVDIKRGGGTMFHSEKTRDGCVKIGDLVHS